MSTCINVAEWRKALADAGLDDECDPEAITASEFASMVGMKRSTAKSRLLALVDAGKATVTKKRFKDASGRSVTCTAYRLVS